MKYVLLFFPLLIALFASGAEVEYSRVDPALFIVKPETDFGKIRTVNASEKKRLVKLAFDGDLFNNEGSKAYDVNADFEKYFTRYDKDFQLIDLDKDGSPELIYNGYMHGEDPKEYLEIYSFKSGKPKQLYADAGFLMAYKIQPNTGEVLLFSHQYPCCSNGSHFISRIRLVEGKTQLVKRFFVARRHDMKGNFFPGKINDSGKYRVLSKKTVLRWSSEVIGTDAWTGRTQENRICDYDKGSVFKVLAIRGRWKFVLVKSQPVNEQGNMVIRPDNFTDTWIYGWIGN